MLAVIACYFLATLVVGAAFSTRIKRVSDYLIAGRQLGLALTTASLAAVQIGAGVILGGAETGAAYGLWPGMWYGLGCGGGLILAGLVAAGRMRRLGGVVPIDFFAARYGERRWVRLFAWLCNIPSLLGIFAAQVMASGLVLSGFGFDFTFAVLTIGAVILVSNVLSGMWGVVAVDLVQIAVILVGIPIAAAAAVSGGGAPALGEILATPFIPRGLWTKAVFLITPFLFSISVSYDAFIRYQAARTPRVAQWACILSGLLVIGASFCAALIGAAGKRAFPAVADGSVLPHVVTTMLPPVAGGVVVAALLAAAMSTANALLISLAGCFSRDFYNKVLHPGAELDDLPHGTRNARLALAVALVLGVAAALRARGILDTIIIFNYPYMGSMMVPLLGGLLWARATSRGAFAAMAVGGAIGTAAFLAGAPGPLHGWFNIDLGLLIAFAVSGLVFVVVSLTGAPSPRPAGAGTVSGTVGAGAVTDAPWSAPRTP
ncbi:MAG: sodium:solute symporter family protein [Gemmatimonadetes bacterium]|nr:sodium:solute symporter family protein [Gemmatimonadota bacterium]